MLLGHWNWPFDEYYILNKTKNKRNATLSLTLHSGLTESLNNFDITNNLFWNSKDATESRSLQHCTLYKFWKTQTEFAYWVCNLLKRFLKMIVTKFILFLQVKCVKISLEDISFDVTLRFIHSMRSFSIYRWAWHFTSLKWFWMFFLHYCW